jgi:UDP-N-acetylmuramyl tripeptide synthase
MRTALAVVSVRLVNWASKVTRRGSGTVAGGRVGLRIAPDLLRALTKSRTVVLVTGTNGKTTTSAMVRSAWGVNVCGNVTGANMPAGHVAALSASGANATVLETDEAWLPSVLDATNPRVVVLLNLSRDQLDRASEVRQMADRWRGAIAAHPLTHIVANASDPLVVYAAELASNVTWVDVPSTWRHDALSCPHCTQPLRFGEQWSCACGFHQPISTVRSVGRDAVIGSEVLPLHLQLPGSFNYVNATFTLAALGVLGVDLHEATQRLAGLPSVQGRYGLRRWRGREIRLLLAKNPAGVDALLEDLSEVSPEVWLAINAQIADGRDPSWLYDAPFERLAGRDVYCLGERRLDIATRLDVANVPSVVVADLDVLTHRTDPVTVIANYTAFRTLYEESTPC